MRVVVSRAVIDAVRAAAIYPFDDADILKHCMYCEGYGYRPRRADEPSGQKAVRCYYCDGSGLSATESLKSSPD